LDVAIGAAERLPVASASVDTVISGYYALRFTDLDLALDEIARVLRPEGIVAFTLLSGWAIALAGRLAAWRLLFLPGERQLGLRLLLGREAGMQLPNDVFDAARLAALLGAHSLQLDSLLGTPYVPLVTQLLSSWTGGRIPHLRGAAAVRFGFDIVAIGHRV
jgi:SAM-dependent methyltransferase